MHHFSEPMGSSERLPSTDAEVISESPMRSMQPASSPPFATPSHPALASYNLALLDDAILLSYQYIPLLDPKEDQRMLTLQVMPPPLADAATDARSRLSCCCV